MVGVAVAAVAGAAGLAISASAIGGQCHAAIEADRTRPAGVNLNIAAFAVPALCQDRGRQFTGIAPASPGRGHDGVAGDADRAIANRHVDVAAIAGAAGRAPFEHLAAIAVGVGGQAANHDCAAAVRVEVDVAAPAIAAHAVAGTRIVLAIGEASITRFSVATVPSLSA